MNDICTSFLLVNPFLVTLTDKEKTAIQAEFNNLITVLTSHDIDIHVFESKNKNATINSFFSSGWLSFHDNGRVAVYPLSSEEKQLQREEELLEFVYEKNIEITDVIDYTDAELEGLFIEGTRSIVLDRFHKIAFASLSVCTDEDVFIEFCEEFEYTPIIFSSVLSDKNELVYTDSILSIGGDFAVFASSAIKDKKKKKLVNTQLKKTGRELIYISEEQLTNYCGNILQVKNKNKKSFILMSKQAHSSFQNDQLFKLKSHGEVLVVDISTIESKGKASVGAMLNEIVLN